MCKKSRQIWTAIPVLDEVVGGGDNGRHRAADAMHVDPARSSSCDSLNKFHEKG
jgi:hypothetical protein